jgi:LmbE family N-acetylglucosaminyl deacetylase
LAAERRILVVAAHPDDEVLGCGGTLAYHARRGAEIEVLILGEGVTSRYDRRESAPAAEVRRLHERAVRAGRAVGARRVRVGDLPDNRFDAVPFLEIVKRIERSVSAFRPDTIYTNHEGDLNVDHELTCRAVLTAARPLPESPVRRIYSFEVLSSTEWRGPSRGNAFLPNRYVDVTRTFGRKLAGLKHYAEEMRAYPHPRSVRAVTALAERRGSESGLERAEAFSLLRDVERGGP